MHVHNTDKLDILRAGDLRRDFPIFDSPEGRSLVYLDSAASAQTPQVVLDAVQNFYKNDYANIHRGVYSLSERATAAFEAARAKVGGLLNAPRTDEIIFTRGATESLNLLARSFAAPRLQPGDEILITEMEHHANIVPWQMVAKETGARLIPAPITDSGEIDLDAFESLLGPRTKLVSVVHVSNALGTVNPVHRITELAQAQGVPVVIDGAQAVPHMAVDVQDIGCDFYVFSGHKLYGPTGIGALWGRAELLADMPPYQGGGDMIETVTFAETTYAAPPARFEAGTPDIAGAIGLGAAIDYLHGIGFNALQTHEQELQIYGNEVLGDMSGLRMIGTAPHKAGVFSFVMDGIHPHDVGTFLANEGIAIRAGHHCAQPVMARYGLMATTRASVGLYNTMDDLDALAAGLRKLKEFFAV
jgi:cysteine desulfurase / selenocysteine lyase